MHGMEKLGNVPKLRYTRRILSDAYSPMAARGCPSPPVVSPSKGEGPPLDHALTRYAHLTARLNRQLLTPSRFRTNSSVKKTSPATSETSISIGLRRYLYITAAITGAAIMIVEILGAKMLSPYVGLSHFVWTAQIA